MLVMLEKKGLIKGESKTILELRTTRFYQLTPAGKVVLETFFSSHDEMMIFLKTLNNQQGTIPFA
jgi:DNA-binding PadR family transcriptional regulator